MEKLRAANMARWTRYRFRLMHRCLYRWTDGRIDRSIDTWKDRWWWLHASERHLPTSGQHGHSPQRHTAAGTAADLTHPLTWFFDPQVETEKLRAASMAEPWTWTYIYISLYLNLYIFTYMHIYISLYITCLYVSHRLNWRSCVLRIWLSSLNWKTWRKNVSSSRSNFASRWAT